MWIGSGTGTFWARADPPFVIKNLSILRIIFKLKVIKCVVKFALSALGKYFFITVRTFFYLERTRSKIRNELKVRSGSGMNYLIRKIRIIYHVDDNKRIEHFPSLMDQLSESSAWRPSVLAQSPQSHQPICERSLQKSSLNGIRNFQMLLWCFRQLCISWMLTL
jgi:hypothetical protein